jgi:hypothetical protein
MAQGGERATYLRTKKLPLHNYCANNHIGEANWVYFVLERSPMVLMGFAGTPAAKV